MSLHENEREKLLKYYYFSKQISSRNMRSEKIRVLVQSIGNDLSVEILWRGANDLV